MKKILHNIITALKVLVLCACIASLAYNAMNAPYTKQVHRVYQSGEKKSTVLLESYTVNMPITNRTTSTRESSGYVRWEVTSCKFNYALFFSRVGICVLISALLYLTLHLLGKLLV